LSFINGLATIPTGPGLGIEVNESALRTMVVHEKDLF
jgi:L-alanine-DL-glutamate epimerase-like enolase superfamily enzyme